jgi:hypothetical protein
MLNDTSPKQMKFLKFLMLGKTQPPVGNHWKTMNKTMNQDDAKKFNMVQKSVPIVEVGPFFSSAASIDGM